MITKEAAAYDNKPNPRLQERLTVKLRSPRKALEAWTGLCYALPALALLLLFRYWPLLFGMELNRIQTLVTDEGTTHDMRDSLRETVRNLIVTSGDDQSER